MIKSIAVFCGSKSGLNSLYEQQATELGTLLAAQNITLIYGGGNKGLMGAVANAVMENGGKVVGIIPQLLTDREHSHQGISELIV
ncbi:MAG: LOG family protein, partial [Ferruginibacter sp.]|nr:LOG family protein [Ferruginibacter sp.]